MLGPRQLGALFLTVTVAACASAKIGYDYDPHADFSGYQTYEWMLEAQNATGDRRVDNAGVDIRIRTAIGAQLNQKGYKLAASEPPDFYVSYHAGLKDLTPDITSQYYSDGMAGYPFGHSVDSRSMDKPRNTAPAIESHLSGSLLVDIVDAASKKLVWRGTADGQVDPGLTSAERNERIRSIVREMFTHFPPK